MRLFLRFLALLLALLLIVLVVNTFRLTPHQLISVPPAAPISIPDSAIQRLAGAIRIPTVSYTDHSLTNTAQFDKFLAYIQTAFPLIHQRLKRETFNKYGLLLEWKGRNTNLKPMLLMGHYDLVPVIQGTQKMWKCPPFGGIIAGDFLYGRGILDDKMSVIALLESTEYLLRTNFQPERTLFLAFGPDVSSSGREAQTIAAALKNETFHSTIFWTKVASLKQKA
ncbi:M20/M25/M40 family metallo-hydrolase [Spirosoma aerolatum]|uniref:M20/M25/M40 family metallo-hydrolase n=1 Tax=Spirosoma aerolatum TaxID=1211326 RepID=UPI0009AD6F9D|nr:M20/M25/M40 family metallo-hydrolase [Spirosoma aerolatum]